MSAVGAACLFGVVSVGIIGAAEYRKHKKMSLEVGMMSFLTATSGANALIVLAPPLLKGALCGVDELGGLGSIECNGPITISVDNGDAQIALWCGLGAGVWVAGASLKDLWLRATAGTAAK